MPVRRRHRSPAVLVALALFTAGLPGDGRRPATQVEPLPAAAGAKMRRLHLVRPDLLPFPIELDVYA